MSHTSNQIISALKKFYCKKNGKHGTIMVQSEKVASVQSSNDLVSAIWFGKCFLFLKAILGAEHDRDNKSCTKKRSYSAVLEKDPDIDKKKLCFVLLF